MTEYTSSPEAIQEWMSARERTAYWVKRHHNVDVELLSPSVPPSIITDSDAPSYGPSDSESSSSSIPPRMLLHYNDGRPDIPLSSDARHIRSRTYSSSHAQPSTRGFIPPEAAPYAPSTVRPGQFGAPSHHPQVPSIPSRHAQSLSYASGPFLEPAYQAHITPPESPEHIVVLPSPQGEDPPNAPSAAPGATPNSQPIRSRAATIHSVQHPQPVPTHGGYPVNRSQQSTLHAPNPRHAFNLSHLSRQGTQSPQLAYSQSDPLPSGSARHGEHASRPESRLPYAYQPPAIVYAPSSRHAGSRYAPPAIVYSPSAHTHQGPSRGPAPIAFSQSDPLPQGNGPHYAPGPPSSRGMTPHAADPRGGTRSRSLARSHGRSQSVSHSQRDPRGRGRLPNHSRSSSRSPTPGLSDAGSQTSGSTYYILPTPGQKVQIIQPGAQSVRTPASVTKGSHPSHSSHSSGHSPTSSTDAKKPFFQRIFSIPKLSSSTDSHASSRSGSRKLRRRHTVQEGHDHL